MATKAQFNRELAKHTATIDQQSFQAGNLVIDAPRGKVWTSDGAVHTLVIPFRRYGFSSLGEARSEAIERMSMGVEDCTIENCDSCQDEPIFGPIVNGKQHNADRCYCQVCNPYDK